MNGHVIMAVKIRLGEVAGQQIEYFEDEKNRVASLEGETHWWWLQNVVSGAYFAYVNGGGNAAYTYASYAHGGVRPAFLIDLSSISRPCGADDLEDE